MADISIYESVVTSEDVTLQLQDISVDVSDSVSITEDISNNLINIISVSSSTSLSDISFALHGLNISAYSQVFIDDTVSIINISFIGTDPRLDHTPRVPVATAEIRFRETISIDGKAPTVHGEASFGSFAEGIAPVATSAGITIEDQYAGYISVEGKAPTVSCAAQFGSFVLGRVPVVSGEATLYDGSINIEGFAPVVSGDITIPNYFISIEGYAPAHTAEITIIVNGTISISGKVPVAYGSMEINEEGTISVDGIAPVVTSTYKGIVVNGNFIVISGYAPVAIMSEATGEGDVSSFTITEKTRFDDLILQYQRWPDEV